MEKPLTAPTGIIVEEVKQDESKKSNTNLKGLETHFAVGLRFAEAGRI